MARTLSIPLIFALFVAGCDSLDTDPDYPSTYPRLASQTLEQLRMDFAQNNAYLRSSLSDFGFCSSFDYEVDAPRPPVLDSLTEAEAEEIIRNFVSHNPAPTGVMHPEDFRLERIWKRPAHSDGSTSWIVKSSNQYVDTMEVLASQIYFHISNRELVRVEGNWFPEVYVPGNFRIDLKAAKLLLIDRVVSHYTIAGIEWKVRVSGENLKESTSALKILPMEYEDRIELHVGWEIYIPGPVSCIFQVDVMTGEVLRENPTIIS